MVDEQIFDHIEALVKEEYEFFNCVEFMHGLDEMGHARMQQV